MSSTESMTLEEAFQLAQRIQTDHPGVIVRAIGRFLSEDELRSATVERWGVSAMLKTGRNVVIWSSISLATLSPSREPRGPKRETTESCQGVLF